MNKAPERIHGHHIPAPRLTAQAWLCIAFYIGGPVVGALALLDVLGYLIVTYGFEQCYGLACWL